MQRVRGWSRLAMANTSSPLRLGIEMSTSAKSGFSSSIARRHAMLSAVVYLTLGALLARLVEGRWAKVYFVGVAILLALLVGASRVYLGVHYPTDVVAGLLLGWGWALLVFHWARPKLIQDQPALGRPSGG